ncbi:MAG: low molecular weight protein-tyrosine phosphatase [Pseudonocardiales bacterium]|jgi:protein-tyrosine phosphatase|nr:low molecular weight protein-tyrosine phosphatase [Pseudonocardiales bacterium]
MNPATSAGDSSPPLRILTVCLGNICRSPVAAAVLQHHGGSAVEVRSAGLRDKWAGNGAHPDMVAAAADRGYDLTGHRARQVDQKLLAWADIVVAMDAAVLTSLRTMADADIVPKLRRFFDDRDVPDPFDKSAAEFAACVALVEEGAAAHLPSR